MIIVDGHFDRLDPKEKNTVADELSRTLYASSRSPTRVLRYLEESLEKGIVLTAWSSEEEWAFRGVAVVTPHPTRPKCLFASDACVPERHRRKGVAASLARAAMEYAAAHGFDEIRAVFDRDAADWQLAFYESIGFLKTNESRNEYVLFV